MSKKSEKTKPNLTGNISIEGDAANSLGLTTTTSTFVLTNERKLESSKFIQTKKGNFIEMVYEVVSSFQITYFPTVNPTRRLVKEIYGVASNGKLELLNTIDGVEQPGHWVEPTIDWKE